MSDQVPPYEAAYLLTREMGKQCAANYIRAVLGELAPEEPKEKAPLLDEGELETLGIILAKVRAVS